MMFMTECSYLVVLGQSPNDVHPHGHVCGCHIRTGRVDHGPGGT